MHILLLYSALRYQGIISTVTRATYNYNASRNVLRFLNILAEFFFTTSETELEYYYQKPNFRIASPGSEQSKT